MKLTEFNNYYTEIYPVLKKLKPSSHLEVPMTVFPEFKEACENEGLFVDYISYTHFLKKRLNYPGKTPKDRLSNSMLVYISLDKNIAKKGKMYDISKKDHEFGEVLGYPKCCIKAYDINKKAIKSNLIPYTPCSEGCKATKKYIDNLIYELKKENINVENFMKKRAVFEKRKWIGITSYCNNKCIFCLDGNIKNKKHKSLSQIKNDLKEGIKKGCTRLVLSGGDPTIHPKFVDIIKIGKGAGYKKIQTITNGRMFYYKKFLDSAVKAGLDEITFSIHGHTKELHDFLTSVDGSFKQTVIGIQNARRYNLIINADIVLNQKNVKYFPHMISFLLNLGIMEFDILQIMPFGRAMDNKKILFYNIKANLDYINKGFETARKAGAVLWTNRFPPEYLEGNEDLIQDPHKLLDEIAGRKKDFERSLSMNKQFKCYGERCSLCYLNGLCDFMISKNKVLNSCRKKIILVNENEILETAEKISKLKNCRILFSTDRDISQEEIGKFRSLFNLEVEIEKEIIITKQNYKYLLKNKFSSCVFSLIPPANAYKNYGSIVPNIKNILPYLYSIVENIKKPMIRNIPYCFLAKKYHKYIIKDDKSILKSDYLGKDSKLDIVKLAEDYIGNKKIKSLGCIKCKFNNVCDGIFQKYIMEYGFKELKPVLK